MRERAIQAADGLSLHVVDWPAPAGSALGRGVLILHGIGEHCGRYQHVAHFLNELGFDVRGYDHRGHGRSGGPRGDVPDSLAMLRDAKQVMDDFAGRYDYAPLLLGHSMGGVLAARFATAGMAPISGLILSSPAVSIALGRAQKAWLAVMHTLAPGLPFNNGLPTRYLSHDAATVRTYEDDVLVHRKISARLLRTMLDAGHFALAHAQDLDVPTLLLVAGDDRMVDASGSERFAARLRPGIGRLHRYPGLYHELFNETQAEAARVFADMGGWLLAQSRHSTSRVCRA